MVTRKLRFHIKNTVQNSWHWFPEDGAGAKCSVSDGTGTTSLIYSKQRPGIKDFKEWVILTIPLPSVQQLDFKCNLLFCN